MRCKMGDLKAGDVFTFGSNERHTVVSVDGNQLNCSYVDAGGTVQPRKVLSIQTDRFVECFTKPTAKPAAKVAAKPAAKVEAPVEEPVEEASTDSDEAPKKRSKK